MFDGTVRNSMRAPSTSSVSLVTAFLDISARSGYDMMRCTMMAGVDSHLSHAAQVDDNAIAQGATGPVVTSAAHRQRQAVAPRGTNGQPDIFWRPAVDDSTRHPANGLCLDSSCGGIAIITWHRDEPACLFGEPLRCSFDLISHFAASCELDASMDDRLTGNR
jgi:hypothetical protein